MGRTKGAILILFITVILTISGFIINTRTASRVSDKLKLASELIEQKDIESAKIYAYSALDEWNTESDKMMIFSSHNITDQIEQSLNIAVSYIDKNNSDLFNAECKKSIILLKQLEELEYPTISNIL